jgi:dolichyl-phosphate-mannose-protein mannosyltransferase
MLASYAGDFEFKSGEKYPDNVNYAVMRIFLAMFGAFMVPFAYFTGLELKFSQRASFLAALMVLCGTVHGYYDCSLSYF